MENNRALTSNFLQVDLSQTTPGPSADRFADRRYIRDRATGIQSASGVNANLSDSKSRYLFDGRVLLVHTPHFRQARAFP